MQDLEKLGRELFAGAQGEALRAVASSPEALSLEKKLDPRTVEEAARSGDPEKLRALLKSVLATSEGRALAEKLSELGK